jgi:hypothetical protein
MLPNSESAKRKMIWMSWRAVPFLLSVTLTLSCVHAYSPGTLTSRREQLVAAGGAATTLIAHPLACTAASPSSPAESIRRSAANLPGYGQTDVFYPLSFSGKWNAKRTIVSSETVDPSMLPMTIHYDIRFIPSIQDSQVVADRGYNEAAMENALNNKVQSYEWSETNPNNLKIVFANGSQRDVKVTKRATEHTEDTVSSSEFQRITTENNDGIPIISANSVLQKWKVVDENIIEGIEIVKDVGGNLGDPLAATGAPSSPKVVSKSRLLLQRIP